jgi:hypothetical protein
MTEPAPFTTSKLIAAGPALAAAGVSMAEAAAFAATAGPNFANFGLPPLATCGHSDGCTNPATHQANRPATPEEAEAHWNALEQHIRSHGNPDYVQNRDGIPAIAELRCDDPQHADPLYLEAKANEQETTDG